MSVGQQLLKLQAKHLLNKEEFEEEEELFEEEEEEEEEEEVFEGEEVIEKKKNSSSCVPALLLQISHFRLGMGDPSSSTSHCSHCERDVPASNFHLHFAHCKRNLERCNLCGEMVAKARADEHYNDVHAPAKCPLCDDTIERELLILHQHDKCPQRMLACGFCDFPVAAVDLDAHTDHCGNRTEMCVPCGKYVRLREKIQHDLQYHDGNQDESGPSTRDYVPWFPSQPASSEPPRGPHNQGHTTSKQKLLVTFAITGIAIVIGTFVLQRRGPNQRQQ